MPEQTPIARQALDLLRNRLSVADLGQLSAVERRQFAEICRHWFLIVNDSTGGAA